MGAEDAVPNRLGAAIESARGIIAAMTSEAGDRVGVVAFAGGAVVRCGLTANLGAASETVRSLRPGCVRPGGTDLGTAIETAAGAFDDRDRADGRMILLFTDGEDLAGAWQGRVEEVKRAGIIIDAVAIGDPDTGHPVPTGDGPLTLSYRGHPVISKRSDEALDALARATGGVVIRLGLASADLGAVYRDTIAPRARRVHGETHPPDRAERYGLFVLGALLALSIGAGPKGTRRRARARAFATTGSLGFAVLFGAGPSGESPSELIAQGRLAYEARLYDEALKAFEAAGRAAPRSAIPRFDAAAALFALGRYAEAIPLYREARALGDPALKVKADFALGNASLMAGDPSSAIAHYDGCITSARTLPGLDAIRRDAEANRDYARLRLEDDPPPPPDSKPEASPKSKAEPAKTQAESRPGEGSDAADASRGRGGAGGTAPDPRPAGERLDDAVRRVREALRNRLPDAPVGGTAGDIKDW